MTLNLSSSRIVIVIRSVAAIHASGAAQMAAGKHTLRESGHLNLAKSGHYNLAATTHCHSHFKMSWRQPFRNVVFLGVKRFVFHGLLITQCRRRAPER
ncbi:hypothetical protein, partial [Paraburkholderia lacunae]|uniref:hypothetical protein n=1 Tax=Paraburkholderia lacunae TaxID=2211104 RepID=UPI001AD7ED17